MKKIMIALVALAVALMAGPALAVDFKLIADGGDTYTDVGNVAVTDDGTNLTVVFTIDVGNWEFVETHLHAADNAADIPQTGKGNPKVGKFAYDQDSTEATVNSATQHTYVIPIPANDGTVVIAAHAELLDGLIEETAWGEGPQFADDRNWAMYIVYALD